MNLWGPYLPERAWGTGQDPREDDTYEAAGSSGKFQDGIFGFSSASGTVRASFAFWNGRDSHLKERLCDEREMYLHGLTDPQHRYCSCSYTYPQVAYPYEERQAPLSRDRAFRLHFELAKEEPTRLFYRLTVTNCSVDIEDLTVAAQLWACHANCGRIEQTAGISNCLRVSASNTCCGLSCPHLDSGNQQQQQYGPHCDPSDALNYRLHYQPEALVSVAISDAANPDALSRLIVQGDPSKLRGTGEVGQRVAIVYRVSVPANSSVSRCFLLAKETANSAPPDWESVPALMLRSAGLAVDLLTPASNVMPDSVKRIVRRAYASILWNRQLCGPTGEAAAVAVSTPEAAAASLVVVPDKWQRPFMSSWEHGLHAIVLCQVSRELTVAELRGQFARMSIKGELAYTKPAPPVWPLALLDFLRLHNDKEASERIFIDLLRHLNWWLLDRKDAKGSNTMDGAVLGLAHEGWIEAAHAAETNDSLIWSGFFCSKMVHLAAVLQHQELKTILDLFNAVLSTLHNDVACVNGLWKPKLIGESRDSVKGVFCSCAFGIVPLFGCACISWDLMTNRESRVLIEWLQWLSNEVVTTETPTLFVKTDANSNRFLLSWITESEFLQLCAPLFDPGHFLSPYGIRCTSEGLIREQQSDTQAGLCSSRVIHGDVVSVPLNYLTLEALKCWESIYGQQLQLEYPTGSGMRTSLNDIIVDLSRRVVNIFTKIDDDSPMFYEFYRADNGNGVGSSHASWSSLVANIAQNLTRQPTLALHVAPVMPRAVGRIMPKNSAIHAFRQSLRSSIKMDEFAPDSTFDWGADIDN